MFHQVPSPKSLSFIQRGNPVVGSQRVKHKHIKGKPLGDKYFTNESKYSFVFEELRNSDLLVMTSL
jgi:hypothetical protein